MFLPRGYTQRSQSVCSFLVTAVTEHKTSGLATFTKRSRLGWSYPGKRFFCYYFLCLNVCQCRLCIVSLKTRKLMLFRTIANDERTISRPTVVGLLSVSGLLAGAFVLWIKFQENTTTRAVLIPGTLWRNRIFISVCVDVFLVWGAYNATETLASLFFQYVQQLSTLETSGIVNIPLQTNAKSTTDSILVRLLPAPFGGALASLLMGLFVHRLRADLFSLLAVITSSLAPLLMAITSPNWPYWTCIFPAMITNAIGANTLYTVSNLVVTSSFPAENHGVAGGVYNTVAQIGRSFGLTISTIIADIVTRQFPTDDSEDPVALLDGYRAAFWYCFATNGLALCVVVLGLRNVGKVGLKQD